MNLRYAVNEVARQIECMLKEENITPNSVIMSTSTLESIYMENKNIISMQGNSIPEEEEVKFLYGLEVVESASMSKDEILVSFIYKDKQ